MRKIPKPQNVGRGMPEAQRKLTKMLVEGDRRYDRHELFSWMLDLTLMRFGAKPKTDIPDDILPLVVELSDTYFKAASEAPLYKDVLGEVYMAAGRGNKWFGQFFTPSEVSRMIAAMTLGDENPLDRSDVVTVLEPCAGAGGMLLAFCDAVADRFGTEALSNVSITAVDLDSACARMTAIQLLAATVFHDFAFAELAVIHGNSLFPDKQWSPVVYATHPELSAEKALPHPASPARKKMVEAATQQQQLAFDWAG